MSMPAIKQLPKPVQILGTIFYVLVSLLMYWFCYRGYVDILGGHFDPWVPVALICFTVIFRLDLVTAAIGFWGAWKGGDMPLLENLMPFLRYLPHQLGLIGAILLTGCFLALSYLVNVGGMPKQRKGLIRGIWRRRQVESPTYVPGTGMGPTPTAAPPAHDGPSAPPAPAASGDEAVVDPNAPKPRRKKKQSDQ